MTLTDALRAALAEPPNLEPLRALLARGGDLTADLIADDPTERDRVLAAAQKWRDVATALREVSP